MRNGRAAYELYVPVMKGIWHWMSPPRTADPLRPHPCEVANSVGIFRELSWLTGGDHKAAGLRSARPPRLRIATGLTVITNKLHRYDYVGAGSFCTS